MKLLVWLTLIALGWLALAAAIVLYLVWPVALFLIAYGALMFLAGLSWRDRHKSHVIEENRYLDEVVDAGKVADLKRLRSAVRIRPERID